MGRDASPTFVSLAAGTKDFLRWASHGQGRLAALQAAMNEPLEARQMRLFRQKEVLELSGLKPHHWRTWVASHRAGEVGEVRLTIEEVHQFMEAFKVRPSKPAGAKTLRLVIAQLKGGAGKTMTTLHLAHNLACRGYRVLLIDGDPQGTLTTLCGWRSEAVRPEQTMAAVFERIDSPELIEEMPVQPQKTHIDGLDFIPASLEMIGSDFLVASAFMSSPASARRFYTFIDEDLKRIEGAYDLVLIDTSPSFSFTALAMMWAADGLLVPMPPNLPDYRATLDFSQMMGENVAKLEKAANITKTWDPVIFAHVRSDLTQTTALVRSLSADTFGTHRVEESVPSSSAFVNAASRFRSVYEVTGAEVDARSSRRAREAYDALAQRVLQSVGSVWARQVAEGQKRPVVDSEPAAEPTESASLVGVA
ncbi:ATPase involved in chromosome partitioning [Rhodanobacter denitrificans]|uniref:ATPase involved in chromosome partitioning n=2 Tax=Rhodanobacter denitrificans TaxID=666685 RepID=M4NHF1_9GAMM|nr:ATPase involved in chromosome partitioning [Rhodanobacter denitrificans]